MGKLITFKWRRASEPKALPPAAENDGEIQRQKEGRRLFADARLHDQSRTLAFGPEDDPQRKIIWCEALNLGERCNWQVKEISAIFHDAAQGGPVQDFTITGTGLSYFEAVDKLADFENSQKNMEGRVRTGPAKNELEFAYYRDMAEHEGIIFDTEDRPHPTLHGEIITNGKFTTEALKTARAFRRDDRIYKDIGSSLIRNMVIGNSAPIQEEQAREIFAKTEMRTQLRELVSYTSDLLGGMRSVLSEFSTLNGKKLPIPGDDDRLIIFAGHAYYKDNIGAMISALPLPEQDKNRLLDIPSYYGMTFFMLAGRYAFARGHLGSDYMARHTEPFLEKSLEFARKAGASEQDMDYIRGYVLRPDIPDDLRQYLPPQANEYLNELKQLRDIADDDLKKSAGALAYKPGPAP